MNDFKARLEQEKKELDEKGAKLLDFIESGKAANIDPLQAQLLNIQLGIMISYSSILEIRLKNL